MKATWVFLPGDGIGPEVVEAARAVLEEVAKKFGHHFDIQAHLMGGCAIDAAGQPLPDATLAACQAADVVLLGAVGGPKWDDPAARVRPEQGLLGVRKALGLYANLRPVRPHPALVNSSPVRPERLAGVDLLVVRELTGGIYFGEPRYRQVVDGEEVAVDTMRYTRSEIERVAHLAFQLAQGRRKKVSSIDKANILDNSRLWRQTVTQVAAGYPDVLLEHILVDSAAMHLINRPASFDVMLAENLFGDILTDEAAVLTGSLGNMPSASIGSDKNSHGFPRGLYEPIHGSAPDIAGQGIANPIGTILSMAMGLRYSLGLEEEARAVESAVNAAISSGARTGDLASAGEPVLTTSEMTQCIITNLTKI